MALSFLILLRQIPSHFLGKACPLIVGKMTANTYTPRCDIQIQHDHQTHLPLSACLSGSPAASVFRDRQRKMPSFEG